MYRVNVLNLLYFIECICSLMYRVNVLNFVSEQLYNRPTQMAWLECFCLLFCMQLMKRLLFKLHLSLPAATMALIDSTVSELLWGIHMIRNCIEYFVAIFLPPFFVLSFYIIFFLELVCYVPCASIFKH
jgi:hypothetical protein